MKIRIIIFISVMLFAINSVLKAQTVPMLPYVLSASGNFGKINNQLYDFSFGEMLLIQTFEANGIVLTQGFLQPYLVTQTAVDVFVVNNFITPNGDGKNDVLLFEGLENYPENKFSIFDRGGRLLYSVRNYQNNWDGYFRGKVLAEDTYYYILDLGKGNAVKGFVSVLIKK